ncbi:ATP phosphoribosyltransferase [Golovinomyces cichoracearum]|uniref:ATP phosphoribosyltransferase n=1 Tax=Golovinomyces cichoracearum TaxID=62708 RepID=A0A420J5U0_9PEZI|nr:ATP phosphoribosyltransferase [Golovinomyces cichoracearum]
MDLVNHLEGRLLFAVPKKGRLLQATLDLLEGADIHFKRENRLDIALVKNLPVALVFLPAADIPTFVGEGRLSLGITGRDTVAEYESSLKRLERKRAESGKINKKSNPSQKQAGCQEILDLGFATCKLQIQVPENGVYVQPADLIGKNVGTSFVNLTKDYFSTLEQKAGQDDGEISEESLKTNVIELSGSVEAACALGVADGIVDLVGKFSHQSGETMKAAGLKAIDTVVDSTAVLIQNHHPSDPRMVELITSRLRGIITARKYVLCQYNIARSKLEAAIKITPGKRAATVNPLEEDDWVAVSAMVEKTSIASVMDQLALVGATDILVLKITNSRST